MNIIEVFGFFKDAILVDIIVYKSTTALPKELQKSDEKFIHSHNIFVENYSNQTINKVSIKYKFRNKFQPIVHDQDEKEIKYSEEASVLTIDNLLPKSELYITMYPDLDDENHKQRPVVYINGNLLSLKSKFASSVYGFFKFKIFAVFTILFFAVIFGLIYHTTNNMSIHIDDLNKTILKRELIDQKVFEYYERKGLKPTISTYDVINVPVNFYEQEDLKKNIQKNCDETYILELNSASTFSDLFKKKQIVVCK